MTTRKNQVQTVSTERSGGDALQLPKSNFGGAKTYSFNDTLAAESDTIPSAAVLLKSDVTAWVYIGSDTIVPAAGGDGSWRLTADVPEWHGCDVGDVVKVIANAAGDGELTVMSAKNASVATAVASE